MFVVEMAEEATETGDTVEEEVKDEKVEEKAYGGGAFDAACAVTVSGRLWKCGTCCTEKGNQGNDFGSIQISPSRICSSTWMGLTRNILVLR